MNQAQQSVSGARQATVAVSLGALGDFLLTLPFLDRISGGKALTLVGRGGYRHLLPSTWEDVFFMDLDGRDGARLFGGSVPPPLATRLAGAACHVFAKPDDALGGTLRRGGARSVVWHDPRPTSGPHLTMQFFRRIGMPAPAGLLDTPVLGGGGRGTALWIHAGSGGSAKNCPPAFFAALAQGWRQRHAGKVVASFGEADLGLRAPLREAFANRGVQFDEVVCPSLPRLRTDLVEKAGLFLGNDSGVTHLAAALGIPAVAFFRATDPVVWRPVGRCTVVGGIRRDGSQLEV